MSIIISSPYIRQFAQTGLQEAASLLRQNKKEAANDVLRRTISEPYRAGQLTQEQYNAVYNIINHNPHEPQTDFAKRQFQPLDPLKGRALNALVSYYAKEISPDVTKVILEAATTLEEMGDIEQAWIILHKVLPTALRHNLVTEQAVKEIYRLMNDSYRTPTSIFLQKLVKENPSAIDDNRLRARALESVSLHLFDDEVMNGKTPKFAVSALPSRIYAHNVLCHVRTKELEAVRCTSNTLKRAVFESLIHRKEATWKELLEWQRIGIALNKDNLPPLRVIRGEIDDLYEFNDTMLESICSALPDLEVLDLGSKNLTDKCLSIVGKYCPNLLSFTRYALKLKTLESLTSGCRKLQHLNLRNCVFNDGELAAISKHCSDIRSIDISQPAPYINQEVETLIKSLKNLEHFACKSYGLKDGTLRALAQCPQLKSVRLYGDSFSTEAMRDFVQGCRAITDLELIGKLNEEHLTTIAQAHLPLKKLSLSVLERAAGTGVAALLQACPQLTELSLDTCDVQDDMLSLLAKNCLELERLDISDNPDITPEGIKNLVEGCPKITDITLNSNEIREAAGFLQALTDSRCNMTRIAFGEGNEGVNEKEFIAFIKRNPRLTHIAFNHQTDVTDNVLIAISQNCPNLQSLELISDSHEVKFTRRGLDLIEKGCPKLSRFLRPTI